MKNDKITTYDYLTGKAFTDKIKNATGCSTFSELSAMLNIPKATFSAWNLHDRTSHELIVRLHLAKGIPIEDLALSELEKSERTSDGDNANQIKEKTATYTVGPNTTDFIKLLPSYLLNNGQLISVAEIPYSTQRLTRFNLQGADLIEVENQGKVLLVDKLQQDAVSGDYLFSIDERFYIGHIQRLPGRLSVVLNDQLVEISDQEIEVNGKVVLSIC